MSIRRLRFVFPGVLLSAVLSAACTIGVFSGRLMSDGRPVIWKNRDVEGSNQAVRYFTDGRYPYLALIWAGEPQNAWGGLNEAGFGIMNSNTFNLGAGAPGGTGDGQLMKRALQTCATIADFQHLLDSICAVGLAVPCNLGVMDSTGATAIFEAGAYSYVRWDADALPAGYQVRANFSLSADTTGRSDNPRYLQACRLVDDAIGENRLSREYLIDTVASDLGGLEFDPYPLPFEGRVSYLPWGFVATNNTICRTKTRAGLFITGRRPGESVELSTMWTVLGPPVVGMPIPLWVGARAVPDAMSDHPTAPLTDCALSLRAAAWRDGNYPDALDTYPLADIRAALAPVKQGIYSAAVGKLREWDLISPGAQDLAQFSGQMADKALSADVAWYSPKPQIEQTAPEPAVPRIVVDRASGDVEILFPGDPRNRELAIYSSTGRRVARFDLADSRQPGSYSISWQEPGTASGRYAVVLDQGSLRRTASFVFVRK